MKINYTGKSLVELHEMYGEGKGGFYSFWWRDELFANEKPEAGEYELLIEKKALTNLTFDEQKAKLQKGWEVPHPAVIVEALLEYHKQTGKYLMADWYSRTSALDSSGGRVSVGSCGARGVDVDRSWDGVPLGFLGLAASRKLENGKLETSESLNLETRVKTLAKGWLNELETAKKLNEEKIEKIEMLLSILENN